MVNYDALPLFPLQAVLFPEIPMPLHIFEPRYREMIAFCRDTNSPFGLVLMQPTGEPGEAALCAVGTTARLSQTDELEDGCLDILVTGETRFRIREVYDDLPYLTAQVEPFWERSSDPLTLQGPYDAIGGLFRKYLDGLAALIDRPLSAVQLPQEPETLSFAVASVLQISLGEKQKLLALNTTEARLEVDILTREIEAQASLTVTRRAPKKPIIAPVDVRELGKLSSLN